MTTYYLLQWNPKNFSVEDFNKETFTAYVNNEEVRWTCGTTKRICQGDRFFMYRTKKQGIIGFGEITKSSYEDEHYNRDVAAKGKPANYIKVRFDYLAKPDDSSSIPIKGYELDSDELKWCCENVKNGKEIPVVTKNKLLELWKEWVGAKEFITNDLIDQIEIEIEKINNDFSITQTEKDQLIKARIGQGKFRQDLEKYWFEKCAVTELSFKPALIASHIKPWKNSDNRERLDAYNGLLLTANLDRLFDQGYISFDQNGLILYKPSITLELKNALGLSERLRINVQPRHQPYLHYHREMHRFET